VIVVPTIGLGPLMVKKILICEIICEPFDEGYKKAAYSMGKEFARFNISYICWMFTRRN